MKITSQQLQRVVSPGFSMIEVVIALAIVAIGLVAIMGVLPAGIHMANDTSGRLGATARVESVFEDIRSVPGGSPVGTPSPQFGIPLPGPGKTTEWTGFFSEGGIESEPENAVWAVDITLSRPVPGLLNAHGRARWPVSPSGFERGNTHLTTAFAK